MTIGQLKGGHDMFNVTRITPRKTIEKEGTGCGVEDRTPSLHDVVFVSF